ncbi:unnamed protein product [Malus baccata var. baccata]
MGVSRVKSECNYNIIIEIATILSSEELLAVRKAYQVRYKHSLEEDLAAHTTGDIRKLLIALVTAYRYDGCAINSKLANSEAHILHDAIKDKSLLEEGGDGLQKALHVALRFLNDPKKYFEKVLRNAVKRFILTEDALTRVIVTRAERDLKDIKEVYYKKNSVPLDHAVAKETSGITRTSSLLCWGRKNENLR